MQIIKEIYFVLYILKYLFGYLLVGRIYSDIRSAHNWATEYIQIFVWLLLGPPNIFVYSFGLFFATKYIQIFVRTLFLIFVHYCCFERASKCDIWSWSTFAWPSGAPEYFPPLPSWPLLISETSCVWRLGSNKENTVFRSRQQIMLYGKNRFNYQFE